MNRSEANTEAQVRARAERSEGRSLNYEPRLDLPVVDVSPENAARIAARAQRELGRRAPRPLVSWNERLALAGAWGFAACYLLWAATQAQIIP
jgi:hypothetical protein